MTYIPNQNNLSTLNSTSTPLNSGNTWQGTSEECFAYSSVTVSAETDKDGSLSIYGSADNSNWELIKLVTITASTFAQFSLNISTKYYRVEFSNTSATNQTYLRVQTILNENSSVAQGNAYDTWSPVEGNLVGSSALNIDVSGNLKSRSQVLTDEVSFRDDFVGSSLSADWEQNLTTGTISVASSNVTIGSGTVSGEITSILYPIDYCPITLRGALSVSQRIANQTVIFGLTNRLLGVLQYGAYIEFTGTSNTVVNCVSSNAIGSDNKEQTTVLLPNNLVTSSVLFYKIDVSNNTVSFSVSSNGNNYILLTQNQLHIPNPYASLSIELSAENSAIVTNTNVACNMVFANNMNRVQTDNDFAYEPTSTVIYGTTDSGNTKSLNSTPEGHLEVAIHSPRLPFGSIHTEKLTPVFQCDGVYGINTDLVSTSVSLSGVATTENSAFKISTGTTSLAQAVIQSRKRLRYRAGQGIVGRFAGLFTTPVADSYQIAGFGHPEDGVYFGYKNTDFGILYVKRGVREVQTLTITTGATVSGNVTITLNSVAFTIAVTNASNIRRTVWEISQGTYAGWTAYPIGATVVFLSNSAGDKTGTFIFSAGATGSAGSIAQTKAGVSSTDTFIPQTEWNGDRLNGQGGQYNGSNALLDPTKGNVYQIGIQYLGFGTITFGIEVCPPDNNNAEFVTVHTIKNPNTLSDTTFSNPSFPFTMAVYSAGSTTNLSVKVGSFAGFIEGEKVLMGSRFSYYNQLTTVGAVNFQALFTIRNMAVFNGVSNQGVINLISCSGAIKHTSPVIYYLVRNGSLGGNPNFSQYSSNSCSEWDTSATTVTFSANNQVIWSGHVGDTGEFDHHFGNGNFNAEEFTLQPNEWITLCAKSTTGSPTYVTCSINTREDI